jgi:hypothetical protein
MRSYIDRGGHSFDKKAVEEWIALGRWGRNICPLNEKETLRSAELIPNFSLRGMIENFVRDYASKAAAAASDTSPHFAALENDAGERTPLLRNSVFASTNQQNRPPQQESQTDLHGTANP